ncbi:MAG: mycothiol conjugate amidase Mca [Chloroflexota bacterium]
MSTTEQSPRLCLMTIHAHPDDEASKGSGTVAKYADEGVRTVLVTCTGGEAGDILNRAMDRPWVKENLKSLRARELAASAAVIGYDAYYLLGYHDSGMPKTEWNSRPDNFHNAPLGEAVGRLVKVIRTERPQVIVTYDEDRQFYGHPDHVRVYEISGPAFDAAADPEQYPEAGLPWQPLKMYYTGRSVRRMKALAPYFEAHGQENPFRRWMERRKERGLPEEEDRTTTLIDVSKYLARRRAALLAHTTQIDPHQGSWFRIPDDVTRELYPWEEYQLARSLVENQIPEGELEHDLFAGLR